MGNGIGKLRLCFAGDVGEISHRRHDIAFYLPDGGALDEGLGYSFCYIRSDASSKPDDEKNNNTAAALFRTISGAYLSANASTSLSTALIHLPNQNASLDKASSFEGSDLFSSIPLQPIPRHTISSVCSGPIPRTSCVSLGSGPVERAFLSGPIERSFISGPLENTDDHNLHRYRPRSRKWALIRNLKRAISKSIVIPHRMSRELNWGSGTENTVGNSNSSGSSRSSGRVNSGDDDNDEEDDQSSASQNQNVQWAHGKAGEDRLQVVISEEHDWVFVGIYDGFYGPDATDFLLSNLYSNVYNELKGLLWDEKSEPTENYDCDHSDKVENCHENGGLDMNCDSNRENDRNSKKRKCEESHRKWKGRKDKGRGSHSGVLKALSEALRKTEEGYFEMADMMMIEHPELALMGSCVLAMLMKGEDVYLMNVGDSRALLAQKPEPDFRVRKIGKNLEKINEQVQDNELESLRELTTCQLTLDHSTSVVKEIRRIRSEHREDISAVINDRVKGKLKVTRAFGAAFLKEPKWNNALLGRFRIEYIGNSPYINCLPSLHHHRLGPRDKFLILSSDGLYQYFTNEEAIYNIELFLNLYPEGDPAQHLVEEVLLRAAKNADMDFHELLDIPQGERRRKYHDDVSIIIISFEGKIWHSSV